MKVLPPGNILQNLYLKERIKKNKWKSFIEIGSGNGYISQLLLNKGLTGLGCDLNESACENNKNLNQDFIKNGQYEVHHQNFLSLEIPQKVDLVISCMVIEHLPSDVLFQFIEKCKSLLTDTGNIVFFVPSSMKYWGIEDEIAGHVKRYEFVDFDNFKPEFGLSINHIAGLTYPMSNWLFMLSNYLIRKKESKMLAMTPEERTIYTGNRDVPYKTTFPSFLGIFLNEIVLYPLHLLQKAFIKNAKSLVIYCELSKD